MQVQGATFGAHITTLTFKLRLNCKAVFFGLVFRLLHQSTVFHPQATPTLLIPSTSRIPETAMVEITVRKRPRTEAVVTQRKFFKKTARGKVIKGEYRRVILYVKY